ncbi:MAG: hypothetical protein WBW33_15975 [Bryobacteraceae bacterium]
MRVSWPRLFLGGLIGGIAIGLIEYMKSFGEGRGKPGEEKLGGERPIEVTGKLVLESPAVTPARTLPSSNVT